MVYKIITPNPSFTGDRAGVAITCGTGITRDPAIADELRGMGYIVLEQLEFDDVPAPTPAVITTPHEASTEEITKREDPFPIQESKPKRTVKGAKP